MKIREFLSDRLGRFLFLLVSMAVMAFFLRVTGTQPGILAILLITWGLLFFLLQVSDYLKCRSHLEELEAVMNGLDQKYLFCECVPKPLNAYERRFFQLMRRSGKAMIEAVSDARSAQRDYREYIESWVHEIKTPITAAQLICRGADPQIRSRLARELAEIDNHAERVLFYARAESPENDFLICQTALSEIVDQAIAHHQTLLIQSGMRIETDNLAHTVYTDGKWVCFILGQLLQNAIRYRSETPVITLSARQLGRQIQLAVRDNGIGIPSHELPRVFERGFTGSNGRSRGGSTGMGLYLGRRLAGFMEIDLQLASEEGRGTCVTLTFPSREAMDRNKLTKM